MQGAGCRMKGEDCKVWGVGCRVRKFPFFHSLFFSRNWPHFFETTPGKKIQGPSRWGRCFSMSPTRLNQSWNSPGHPLTAPAACGASFWRHSLEGYAAGASSSAKRSRSAISCNAPGRGVRLQGYHAHKKTSPPKTTIRSWV